MIEYSTTPETQDTPEDNIIPVPVETPEKELQGDFDWTSDSPAF